MLDIKDRMIVEQEERRKRLEEALDSIESHGEDYEW